jgi:hypothetical protein
MRTILVAAVCAVALSACGGKGSSSAVPSSSTSTTTAASGIIALSPSGTVSAPANESILTPFVLTASESGYSGNFTAKTIVGTCWVVQAPTTAAAAFVVRPSGLLCVGGFNGDTEQIEVTDSLGHQAITYIHSV